MIACFSSGHIKTLVIAYCSWPAKDYVKCETVTIDILGHLCCFDKLTSLGNAAPHTWPQIIVCFARSLELSCLPTG